MKKLLFFFVLLFVFSGTASAAQFCYVTQSSTSKARVGDIVDFDKLFDSFPGYYRSGNCAIKTKSSRKGYLVALGRTASGCPVGKTPNEDTGRCEEPKIDFCSSSEFLEISASEGNACAAKYPNFLTDFSSTCVDESNYSFTCNQGTEKPPVTDPDPDKPDPDKPDPDKPDPDKPDPDKPDPDKPDPDKPDPDKPDPDKPDPDKPDPDKPDPDKPDPEYGNSGNATGSGSSGGSASASDGNVSVDISFDGVHNRLDAVNENLAGTNERIETTNNLLNDFSNRYNKNTQKNIDAIDSLNSDLGKKLDSNGKQITDAISGLGGSLDDIADGSNTTAGDFGCGLSDFSCDGNSYECYIARTNWKNRCLMETLTGDPLVPREGVPVESSQQVSESGDALINDLKGYSSQHLDPDKLSNGDVLITDSLDKFNESNGLSFDEKCPSPNVVDTGMGKFTIDYTPFCDLALYVRAMLMLFASIGSILMISKFS